MNLDHKANYGEKTHDKAIIRIKNMLALQAQATTQGEAEAAEAAATAVQRELLKHNLELSDVELFEVQTEEPVEQEWLTGEGYGFKRAKRRIAWIENLASAVARAHFCRIIVSSGSNRIAFVGRKSNRAVAVKSFAYLVNVATELVEKDTNEYKANFVSKFGWEKPDVRSFRDSYLKGFASELENRFFQQRRSFEEEQKEMAKREAEAKREVQRTNIREEVYEQHFDEWVDERLDELAAEGVNDFDPDAVVAAVEMRIEAETETRLKEIPAEVVQTGLIRLEKEREAVDDWFGRRKWGTARSVGYRSSHNSAGWAAGSARGRSVSTSGNVLRG